MRNEKLTTGDRIWLCGVVGISTLILVGIMYLEIRLSMPYSMIGGV